MHSMKMFLPCALAGFLLSGSGLQAQTSMVAPRITSAVDESSLTTLRGNVPLLAEARYDQGEAPAATQLDHVRLVLSRSSQQQAALDQYLAEVQDKASPNFHRWLTPEEFGQLYGPADSDIAALVAWLQSHGLTVETVSKGRTNIAFSGTVSQVEEAFHTAIHSFSANGRQFYSNTADPQIPSALAPAVEGVAHLNTIRPQPEFVRGSPGRFNPETRRMEPLNAASAPEPRASLTGGAGTTNNPYELYLVPGDAATIYDTPNSTFNANYTSGNRQYTGAGVNIGVGGAAVITPSIVQTYRNTFLGSSYDVAPNTYYCTSSSTCSTSSTGTGTYDNVDNAGEAYIDTELAGALAPGAKIYYYASPDLDTGIEAAIDANVVDIFGLSFGECEQALTTSENAVINELWEQAAAQGIAVTVATGDTGSAACDYGDSSTTTTAKYGLAVNGLASTAYDIAVGGTDFYLLGVSTADFEEYAYTSNQGSSSNNYDYYTTVKAAGPDSGYIPESTWNDSTYTDTTIADNEPWTAISGECGTKPCSNYANIVAGGGGASSCSTNTNTSSDGSIAGSCTSGYARPSWQRGAGVPSSPVVRDLPDVSLMAGNGYDAAGWLICDASYPCTSITSDGFDTSGGFDAYGGTSTSTQVFSGILALVEQSTGGRLGQAAAMLYNLYNGSDANSVFHDTTVGNNSVPCTVDSADISNCLTNSAGNDFESGYNTTTGYDLATGLGSVDVKNLVNDWSTAYGSTAATVVVDPQTNPIVTGTALDVSVTVTGSNSVMPAGTVTLTGGSYTSSATWPQSTTTPDIANYSFTIPGGDLPVGAAVPITATFNGDANYGAATKMVTEEVTTSTGSTATYALTANATSATVAPGGPASSTITVATTSSYAGTVTLTCALTTYPSGATDWPNCSFPNGSTVTLSPTSTPPVLSGSQTLSVTTTGATSELIYPKLPGHRGLLGAGGGAVLALLVFLGIPARRRGWRSMLGVLVLMAALGSLSACGGGGGASSSGGSGTTAGTYIFTVTGTGNPAITPAPTTTFTVKVD